MTSAASTRFLDFIFGTMKWFGKAYTLAIGIFIAAGVTLAIIGAFTPTDPDPEDDVDNATASFGGYECLSTCIGHQRGFKWAEQKKISQKESCTGNSLSFREGCKVFIDQPWRTGDIDDQGRWIEAD